ncbi:MAG: hypothetical protein QOG15_1970 [Solirubrobacteraceae bacterium]|nr:hypothetical protein [Solirubrobacteraceae bacterium]
MIPIAGRAERVLLDTSVFINFADGGALFQLSAYLADRATVALDVDVELRRNAAGRFPALKTLGMLKWPPGEPLALPPDQLADAEALRRLHSAPGAHEDANRGEIATALLAGRIEGVIVVMDDMLGKQLCRTRGVARLSSAQLSAEMVVVGALDAETGLRVFDVATPARVGKPEFDVAIARARDALR